MPIILIEVGTLQGHKRTRSEDTCGLFLMILYHVAWCNVGLVIALCYLNAILELSGGRNVAFVIATMDSYALIFSSEACLNGLFFLTHFLYVATKSSRYLR